LKTQAEYFQAHAVEGALSPEHLAAMLTLPEGESLEFADPATTEQSGKPDAAATEAAAAAVAQATKTDPEKTPSDPKDGQTTTEQTPAPVILAKDGVHTIPYEKLEEQRARAKAATEAAEAATAEAERLRQEIVTLKGTQTPAATTAPATTEPAKAGSTPGDTGLGAVDFGDYSDASIAKAVAQMVERQTAPLQAELATLKGKASQTEQQTAVDAATAHYNAIRSAHKDADSIVESSEFKTWKDAQPAFVRAGIEHTLADGSTKDVIDVFSTYKQATGKTGAAEAAASAAQASQTAAEVAAAAQAAIAAARTAPPTSLSEIPAGSAAHHDPAAAMLEKSSASLMTQFHGMDPQEVMRRLDKVI
jgi:hypothetical protein